MKQVFTREHLVAVRAFDAHGAHLVEKGLQAPAHAAVAVHDHQSFISGSEVVQLLSELIDDPGRIEVKQRRDAVDVDLPSSAIDDVLYLRAEGSANDKGGGLHPTSSRCGN